MRYHTYSQQSSYPLCILSPTIDAKEIQKIYLDPYGVPVDNTLILDLHTAPDKKKTPVKEMKEYVESELVPTLEDMGVKYLLVADSEYFKLLTKQPKTEANLGYVLDCVFGPWKVVYVPNFRAVFYAPDDVKAKIKQGMEALLAHARGHYQPPGQSIIKFEAYPSTLQDIAAWLEKLLEMNVPLSCDIEAFSLKHHSSGIGTITFCWNEHEGIAFAVDYQEIPGATEAPFGRQVRNDAVRDLLKSFFKRYTEKMIYHNISYDVYALIYQLFMHDLIDTEGLLNGIDVMLRNWDDTKIITYLATNTCAGNHLSLKDQAQEFAGNYAQNDIHDITRIRLPNLLQYNLVDGLSTWYVHKKHYGTMVADNQLDVYESIFKPATVDIIQMQLTGMPINMLRVLEVEKLLHTDHQKALETLRNSSVVQRYTHQLREKHVTERNAKLKKKQISMTDKEVEMIVFNPESPLQLQGLLFDMLGFPVIAKTKSKQPATGKKTIEALKNHTSNPEVLEFLDAMLDYSAVAKILSSFLPAMLNAVPGPDGWHYLFGNFNIGGTLSGRLSSSDPNLQNLPASSKYAKLIKSCFMAPPGWLFCGLDFASLEDRISALTTKDPNKLKVYTDGFDGHAMRAVAYWGDQMPDINPDDKDSVNALAKSSHPYYPLRNKSKAPTFAMTYQGTYITLMKNCGFTKEQAVQVVERFKQLYKVSIDWVDAKLHQAGKDGYITAAFGLRIRTPLLAQVIRGTSKTPAAAEAEGRSAGNALGQSWCLLNNRAGSEFMGVVRKSSHRLNVRPCAQIHDAQYMMVRNNLEDLMFVNEHLVKAVQWQDHPDIWHPEVKLGGELSVFYPSWEKEIGIPNGASKEEILEIVASYNQKKEAA